MGADSESANITVLRSAYLVLIIRENRRTSVAALSRDLDNWLFLIICFRGIKMPSTNSIKPYKTY